MFNFFKWLLMLKICKCEPEFARFLEFHGAKVQKKLTCASKNVNIFQL